MNTNNALELTDFQIEKIRNKDVDAFEILFKTFYKPLLQFAYRYLNDVDMCKDVVQEVFYKIWENSKNLDSAKNIKSYLFTAVRNQCLKKIQKLNIEREYASSYVILHDDIRHIEDHIHAKELEKQINDVIDKLPEKGKMIFCLSRFDKLTYAEIAKVLDISVKTVETHMSRALKAIQPALVKLLEKI